MDKIVVLSGAGMSAESGIKTFRDADGLWEGHDVMEVASPEGWRRNQEVVLDFYNQRRKQLFDVEPNQGHRAIAELQKNYQVKVITQNVDDLHERAGSKEVMHLHGELLKVRSTRYSELIYEWKKDLHTGDLCERGFQLRPHIVWFGEAVPMIEPSIAEIQDADIVIVIGTSMQVYPAASLIAYAPARSRKFYIDPKPSINYELQHSSNLEVIKSNATDGMAQLISEFL